MLLANPHIEQCCVVGMGIPQPIALVVLSEKGKKQTVQTLKESLLLTLKDANGRLENFEQLEKIIVLSRDWTIENGLMTPTLKVKRNEIEKIYLSRYRDWYHHHEPVLWEHEA